MAPGAWEPLDKYPNDYIIRYNPQEKGLQQEGMTIIPTQTRGAQAVLRGPPLRTPTLPGADPLVSGCLSLLRVQVILDSCTKITGATCVRWIFLRPALPPESSPEDDFFN